MIAACELRGNPSSVHAEGRAARALIERARAEVAAGTLCGGRDRALLLPGALLVAIGAQLLAAFMFVDLGFSAFL